MRLRNFFTLSNTLLTGPDHPRLVLEPITTVSSMKRRCPTAAKESNASGDSFRSTKKNRASGVGEENPAVKYFRPRVMKDGPPSGSLTLPLL
ncbi:hypothetical protein D8674_037843 [Pyrus ussuriensis x Pyrus communis]|uniref:Uncharacterized protein n=1 Tax=Pyrus ussuriensis x Pyrus communis TaxID=2448454 RepID=A0A5N5HEK0_9ROSA|nr:hypothetical protein D8674_037843 [Pyrus ussuriensis x Pyrus communis]